MDSLGLTGHVNASLANDLEPLTRRINEKDLHILACSFAETYSCLALESTEHFLATPVTALPTGRETGKFLAIDVGGTNLRVAFVELLGEHEPGPSTLPRNEHVADMPKIRRSYEKAWPIDQHLKMDQAEDLFAWIGDCIAGVITDALEGSPAAKEELGDEVPLGITFSFPMAQTSMAEATLMAMGKGFAITSNLNLGKMLLAGYERHCGIPRTNGNAHTMTMQPPNGTIKTTALPRLRIAAITNDTVATYTSLAYSVKSSSNSRVAMGVIVGTGTNATVPMRISALHPSKRTSHESGQNGHSRDKIVINTEWTIRGSHIPLEKLGIPTKWDEALDKACEAPGFQPFEYMTGGRYLGEVVRHVLLDLLSRNSAMNVLPPALLQKDSISTVLLATSVASGSDDVLLKTLLYLFPESPSATKPFWTTETTSLLRAVALAVSDRSSALIAAAIVGLLACVGEISLDSPDGKESASQGLLATSGSAPLSEEAIAEELVVAYTGGVISHYPGYLDACQAWIDKLVRGGSSRNATKRVLLGEATDGGVIGAAVLAGPMGAGEVSHQE
ncbi:hexokinase-2 [Saccharata proteae CBS 121410]|uniref:Phosphotransferase n=1 Tax=Saccharata proteae CBS 121410 TaxID=1314787 RepID=A0A9P4HMX8_9PEZI|nr:hexokinase-2 [Saccharata proteae CBS 121410]